MKYAKSVEEFFESHQNYSKELDLLREILLSTDLEEGLKWGGPAYMIDGKNVIGLGAFKSYVGLWFHNGVFLEDKGNRLQNAQESTKAMRQWRFHSLAEIVEDKDLIRQYVLESIDNQRAGKVHKVQRSAKGAVSVPKLLDEALKQDAALKHSFEKLSTAIQREYCAYITEAKRETTKERRLEKIKPMILGGQGLNDAYKSK